MMSNLVAQNTLFVFAWSNRPRVSIAGLDPLLFSYVLLGLVCFLMNLGTSVVVDAALLDPHPNFALEGKSLRKGSFGRLSTTSVRARAGLVNDLMRGPPGSTSLRIRLQIPLPVKPIVMD